MHYTVLYLSYTLTSVLFILWRTQYKLWGRGRGVGDNEARVRADVENPPKNILK